MRQSILLLFLFNFFTSICQYNYYKVIDYTPENYGLKIESQVLCITQGLNGNIYSGTGGGMLEFNGSNWNYYPVKEDTWVTAIFIDSNKIYIGGNTEFGFLINNSLGVYNYYSLSDSLSKENTPTSPIRNILKLQNGQILFQAENLLYLYNNTDLQRIIKPETSFHKVFYVDNKLIIRQRDIGLMEYSDTCFKLIEKGDYFKNVGIFAVIPNLSNDILYIVTNQDGIYSIDNELKNLKLFNNNKLITTSSIYGGQLLSDNSLMLFSNQNGLLNLNPRTSEINLINEKAGLTNNEINMITEDCYGNIWCAGNYGISKIRYNLLYSIYSKENGINGKIGKIFSYNNQDFIATSMGLFAFNKKENSFNLYQNISNQIWDITAYKNRFFIATDEGITELSGRNKISYINHYIRSFGQSGDNHHFLAVGNNEIYYWKNNRWSKLDLPIRGDLVNIIFINNKDGWNNFYIGSFKNGLYKLSMNINDEVKIENFTINDGLPGGWIVPYSLDSSIVIASQSGLFRYVSPEELSAQLPDSLKQLNIELSGYFELANVYGYFIQESVTAFQDKVDKVWISNGYNIFYIDKKTGEKISNPFKEIKMGKLSTIFCPNNKSCLIGSDYGLIAIDLSKKIFGDYKYSTKINRVYSINDSLNISPDKSIILPYNNNSLEFQFSAPYYNAEKDLQYSYKLEGHNDNWSSWSTNNRVDFLKLKEGDYNFYVKAQNVYNKISLSDSINFSINPPWFRSIIAYIVYCVLVILFIYLLIQLNVRRLKIKNQKLENIITERTKEIREQRDEIKKQKQEITDSIHYAQRIQSAVLPSASILDDIVSDHFILYLPRDIVSGDFYWIGRVNNKLVILAADCTGHGVPGAFMSMLGVAFLNEIVNKKKIFLPNKILDNLRDQVIEALKQEGKVDEAKDGMDMAIITIDLDNNKLYYAGANNPLFLIQNGEMLQIKADKMPVAIYHKLEPFKLHEFELTRNNMLYIFSDGYQDQFGGEDGRKYMTKRFREYLQTLEKYPLSEQKDKLYDEFIKWRGEREQIDDVLVFGIKL